MNAMSLYFCQKIIYERFLKIWEYPNVDISKFDIYDEENIFDADPTNKKLQYFYSARHFV